MVEVVVVEMWWWRCGGGEGDTNVHYDQSVRFCTGTERSADSTECTCIGDISFSSVASLGYKSAGFIIINQSNSFYRTATQIKALT